MVSETPSSIDSNRSSQIVSYGSSDGELETAAVTAVGLTELLSFPLGALGCRDASLETSHCWSGSFASAAASSPTTKSVVVFLVEMSARQRRRDVSSCTTSDELSDGLRKTLVTGNNDDALSASRWAGLCGGEAAPNVVDNISVSSDDGIVRGEKQTSRGSAKPDAAALSAGDDGARPPLIVPENDALLVGGSAAAAVEQMGENICAAAVTAALQRAAESRTATRPLSSSSSPLGDSPRPSSTAAAAAATSDNIRNTTCNTE